MLEKFIIHYDEPNDDPVHIEAAGISHCDGSYRIRRERSTFYVMEAIAEGQGVLEVNGQRFHPKAGDGYLIPIHSRHFYHSDSQHPWVKYWFNVNGDAFDAFVRACGIQNVILFPQCHLEGAFKKALDDMEGKTHNEMTDLGAGHVIRLIRLLHQAYRERQEHSHPMVAEALEMKAFLERHICAPVPSVQQLCQLTNHSEVHVRRIFKQAFKVSPVTFLLEAKIRLARKMLESSDISIKELTAMLGFSNPFYFSRLFKQKTGLSPAHYHQAHFPHSTP